MYYERGKRIFLLDFRCWCKVTRRAIEEIAIDTELMGESDVVIREFDRCLDHHVLVLVWTNVTRKVWLYSKHVLFTCLHDVIHFLDTLLIEENGDLLYVVGWKEVLVEWENVTGRWRVALAVLVYQKRLVSKIYFEFVKTERVRRDKHF